MERPLLLLSDTHLSRDYGSSAGHDLARVIRSYPDCEIVLAGDIFDLSLDEPGIAPADSLARALSPHEKVIAALSTHIARGQKVTLIPGNHDAGLQGSAQVEALRSLLKATDDRTVEVATWFIRRGTVHIEHGHLYDPDCANNHPLAPPNARSEGLGTALMRRFVAPNDALFFAHANQTTMTSGLKMAFDKWGVRAPLIIYDYMKIAAKLCLEARTQADLVARDRALGNDLLEAHAALNHLSRSALEELLRFAPMPTHHSMRATFFRLYFDRVLALATLGAGLSALSAAGLSLAGGMPLLSTAGALTGVGALLAVAGGSYLAVNTAVEKNRYGHKVIGQLDRAASQVQKATDSSLVVFGHTHVEVNRAGYLNLGSFGYGKPERPYALIGRDGKPERRRCSNVTANSSFN